MEENKELDDFIKKSMNEVGLENPSVDFTNLVMSKINVENEANSVFKYQPLISITTWFIIISLVTAIFIYVIIGQPSKEATWFSVIQLNKLSSFNLMGSIPNISVSNTFIYGIVAVPIFVWIQILVLKRRVDKAYNFN